MRIIMELFLAIQILVYIQLYNLKLPALSEIIMIEF